MHNLQALIVYYSPGSKAFMENLSTSDSNSSAREKIIGQFGVGLVV
jgi:HSP90 family molecular chaperone